MFHNTRNLIRASSTDVLVIGSGLSGLIAAIEARKVGLRVTLVTKNLLSSCTAASGGTISAATYAENTLDSPRIHFQDTLAAGRLINDPKLVSVLARDAASSVNSLQEMGVPFQSRVSELTRHARAGHTVARSTRTIGEGLSLVRPLIRRAQEIGIRLLDQVTVFDLVKDGSGVQGAIGFDGQASRILGIEARSTVVCSGGFSFLYLNTNNPPGMLGEGCAMGIRAGAKLVDMEFVQFYPFHMCEPDLPKWNTPYETIIGAGGFFVNEKGADLLGSQEEISETTRDKLAIAAASTIAEGHSIFLDLQNLAEESWDSIPRLKRIRMALEKRTMRVRVSPVAHHSMGGLRIDDSCFTGVPNLYAAGECVGGIHGANRLSGNALSEAMVFGTIAGRSAAQNAKSKHQRPNRETLEQYSKSLLNLSEWRALKRDYVRLKHRIRLAMWRDVGVIREKRGLEAAIELFRQIREERQDAKQTRRSIDFLRSTEIQNMLTVCEVVARSALKRTESRGSHYRSDFPEENEVWLRNIVASLDKDEVSLELRAISSKDVEEAELSTQE